MGTDRSEEFVCDDHARAFLTRLFGLFSLPLG